MSGMSDGVSKVWTVQPAFGGGLSVDGHDNHHNAAMSLLRHESWNDVYLDRLLLARRAINLMIRAERRQRRGRK